MRLIMRRNQIVDRINPKPGPGGAVPHIRAFTGGAADPGWIVEYRTVIAKFKPRLHTVKADPELPCHESLRQVVTAHEFHGVRRENGTPFN